jgi:hypothetical protein
MVTVDQFCDRALLAEMASAGCLGVAVGLASLDAENCIMQLQHWALRFTAESGHLRSAAVANVVRVGRRGRGLKFAGLLLAARQRGAKKARMLLARLEQAMAANGETTLAGTIG